MALLALCGERRDLSVSRVPLDGPTHEAVTEAFIAQEAAFRHGEEMPFDQNWVNEGYEISTMPIPPDEGVFDQIGQSTDASLSPVEDIEEIRGLAMRPDDGRERILVQAFSARQVFGRHPALAMFLSGGAYTRLESPGLQLGTGLVCIVEDGQLKFRSLASLGRVIDTTAIFHEATDDEVRTFAGAYPNLFEFDGDDIDRFVNTASSRTARKCIASLNASGTLLTRSARALEAASKSTKLNLQIRGDRIVMPTKSGEITELMRFLNDNRYVGPVSGEVFIANSRRRAVP